MRLPRLPRLRSVIAFIAMVGKPLLRLAGVKKGTVADKVVEADEVIDKALPKEEPKP